MSEKAKESMERINGALDKLPPDAKEKVAEFAATFTEGLALGVSISNPEKDTPSR